MSDNGCFEGCWMIHHPCALKEIKRLTIMVSQFQSGVIEPDWMKRIREPSIAGVPCGDELTHKVVLYLHREGPTWASASDDPPTR